MNEFLQHLRATSNERRRNTKNYKNNDGNIGNHHPERRSGNDRRLRAPKPSGIKEEAISSLKQSIDEIQNAVQDHILVLERNTDAQERQAEALEHIADMFAAFMDRLEEVPPQAPQETVPREAEILDESNLMLSAEDADQIKKTSRTYILNLIQSLRDKNSTYDEIALYLTENNFPTFSGRGRWHAQTIHRLCQEIKKAKAKKLR
ncbi:MAG: hypothetical protein RBR08_15945 [Desulforegulaceae bacterium]|nr:hypothetical protein [Desulforegulaceae bacterium]